MKIRELAELSFEKQQMAQELGEEDQDTGDEIYCQIGELLAQIGNEELTEKIDMLILEMSEADKHEYFVKGFEAGINAK
jgi:hypothetical protein